MRCKWPGRAENAAASRDTSEEARHGGLKLRVVGLMAIINNESAPTGRQKNSLEAADPA